MKQEWKILDPDSSQAHIIITEAGGTAICKMKRSDKNVNLIAAAPDMYEVLKKQKAGLRRLLDKTKNEKTINFYLGMIEEIDRVISKANPIK